MNERAIETRRSVLTGAVIPKYQINASGFRHTNKLAVPSIPRVGERIVMGVEHWIVTGGRYEAGIGKLVYHAEFEAAEQSQNFIDDVVHFVYKNGLMYINGKEHLYRSESPAVGDFVCGRQVKEITKIYTNCVLFKGKHLLVNTETILLTVDKEGGNL